MSEKKELEKIEKIRNYILKSGYPAEIEIGNILRKSGWIVGNQWPYIDEESRKIRPVDVLALRMSLLTPTLGIELLIECKKSLSHDWVFHTQEKGKEYLPFLGAFIDFLKKIERILSTDKLSDLNPNEIMTTKLSGLHLLDKAIKIGVFNVIPSSEEKDDFYDATMKIISALESMRESTQKFIVFPTIVFDGEIFEFFQENGETKIQPINHLQFMSFIKGEEGMLPCMIDVVRKSYFSDFLKMVEKDFQILTEVINEGVKS